MAQSLKFQRFAAKVVALLLLGSFVLTAAAQQSERPTSLDIVPQSASFYLASMNHEAQLDAIFESNAYTQLMDTHIAKQMRRAYRKGRRDGWRQFGFGNPFADYLEGYSETIGRTEAKLVLPYVRQVLGNELFVYADEDWLQVAEAMTKAYGAVGEQLNDIDFNDLDPESISDLLGMASDALSGVNTPHLIMGSVVDEPSGIKSLLQIAESLIVDSMDQLPPELDYVMEGFDVIDEDDAYFLTLTLTSDMLPWEDLEGDTEFEPYLDDIKAILKDKSFNLSLGMKDKFLILAFGPNSDHLLEMGKGDLLIDHPRLTALKEAAGKHAMTSVSYTSEELARYGYNNMDGTIDTVMSFVQLGLKSDPSIEEAMEGFGDDLEGDIEELKADLLALTPKPGTYLGFSYIFEGGIEGFVYNWSENKYLDDSRPLTMIDQFGETPAMFAVNRDNGDTEQFDIARKWAGRVYEYIVKYVPRSAPSARDATMFIDFANVLRPILSTVANSTEDNLLQASKNSEVGFVLDFGTRDEQWHEDMPAADQPLPVPAFAILIQHNDKSKIKQVGQDYFNAVVDITDLIRELEDADIPDNFEIPAPLSKSAFDGDLYFYELPAELGVNATIQPHALLKDDLLLMGYCLDQTARLSAGANPKFEGLLADRSRNLMSAVYYDNHQFIDALNSWAQYGIALGKADGMTIQVGDGAQDDTLTFNEEQIMEGYDHVVQLIKCFESVSSISYMQDGAQVTRYQLRMRDVPAK